MSLGVAARPDLPPTPSPEDESETTIDLAAHSGESTLDDLDPGYDDPA
jgi:hypothetical protein